MQPIIFNTFFKTLNLQQDTCLMLAKSNFFRSVRLLYFQQTSSWTSKSQTSLGHMLSYHLLNIVMITRILTPNPERLQDYSDLPSVPFNFTQKRPYQGVRQCERGLRTSIRSGLGHTAHSVVIVENQQYLVNKGQIYFN